MKYPKKHVFVCVNKRLERDKRSCGDDGLEIRTALVKYLALKGVKGVRVNKSGCLNACHYYPYNAAKK